MVSPGAHQADGLLVSHITPAPRCGHNCLGKYRPCNADEAQQGRHSCLCFLIPARFIWSCACVRGWPQRGLVSHVTLCLISLFFFHPHFKRNFIYDLIAKENPLVLTVPAHQLINSSFINYNVSVLKSHSL